MGFASGDVTIRLCCGAKHTDGYSTCGRTLATFKGDATGAGVIEFGKALKRGVSGDIAGEMKDTGDLAIDGRRLAQRVKLSCHPKRCPGRGRASHVVTKETLQARFGAALARGLDRIELQ